MNSLKTFIAWMVLPALALLYASAIMGDSVTATTQAASGTKGAVRDRLDANEVTHLIFLREEEKLERDVFSILGSMYPDSTIFGHIDDIEQGHTDIMKRLLKRYGIKDPNNNDNLGVFTGESYGSYLTANYRYLVGMGSLSELDAFYVSAFIEESNLLDIMQCPKVILDQNNGIDKISQCGMAYTHKREILNVYRALIEGSKSDLRAYVGAIEKVIGRGSYKAQVLSQDQVDEILGRVRSK